MKKLLATFLLLTSVSWAEPVQLKRLSGQSLPLEQLRKASPNGVLMLVSWCAECPSCRRVERQIERLAQDYRSEARVVVVDVHAPDDTQRIRKFLKSQNLNLEIVFDGNLLDSYQVEKTATALIFDRQGKLRYSGPFSTTKEELARVALGQLLRGEAVSPERLAQNGCTFIRRGAKAQKPQQCDLPK